MSSPGSRRSARTPGCAVSKVDGAQVICPCHGSTFGLDGAVVSGPAREPLTPAPITVQGDSIVAG
ncbi:MAG: Rieske (2Fe-2S) protein [Mycobacterium sp.]|nr:Rieske (2Fe-2S) protein [Mycobacterium sp.]